MSGLGGAVTGDRVASPRVRLAQLARSAALVVPGVVDLDAGPSGERVTLAAGERLPGVTALAQPDGRYAVTLNVVARMLPLEPLAETIRAHVRRAAAAAGLGSALGPVDVVVVDLVAGVVV